MTDGTSAALFAAAAGESLHRWYDSQKFCGRCGARMEKSTVERAMVCPHCKNTVYPKICPAVIVAVHDGDRLLLTRYRGRPFKKYALIAGFNEIGESIEDTVHREVMEEAGLRVKNLRFYKSQPWVFTDTLLMGFVCELDGSDRITVQESELAEASWHLRSELPEDHSHISLTGEIIEQFRLGRLKRAASKNKQPPPAAVRHGLRRRGNFSAPAAELAAGADLDYTGELRPKRLTRTATSWGRRSEPSRFRNP